MSHAIITDAIAHLERTACPLLYSEPGTIPEDVYRLGMQWIEQIMRPHPDLGRTGAVCPFAQPSYETGSLYVASLDTNDVSFETFVQIVLRLPESYKAIQAASDTQPALFSLVIFLPHLEREQYFRFVDLAHAMVKPLFMHAGLMLGEFHPDSIVTGAHSNRFYPMRSAIPAFVIRAMAPHDILFIDGSNSPTAVRIHELECYLAWTKVPVDKRKALLKRIAELKGEVDRSAAAAAPPRPLAPVEEVGKCPFPHAHNAVGRRAHPGSAHRKAEEERTEPRMLYPAGEVVGAEGLEPTTR
jgi:hypothetical protein